MPLTTPLTASFPNGPASKVIGAAAFRGPAIGGVDSGVGADAVVVDAEAAPCDGVAAGADCEEESGACCAKAGDMVRKLRINDEMSIRNASRYFIRLPTDAKSSACLFTNTRRALRLV